MPERVDPEMADALLWLATTTVYALRAELADIKAMTMTQDGLTALLSGSPEVAGHRLGWALGRSTGLLNDLDRRLAENWTPPAGRHA